MINKINNTTKKANPPAKPQLPQLPPYPIAIVSPLNQKVKLGFISGFLMDSMYFMILRID